MRKPEKVVDEMESCIKRYRAKQFYFDDQSFVEWIVLLLMIAAIGTLISSFAVGAGAFVLNVSNFTISGLAFTVLYVLLAELILHKAGVKI